MLYVIVFAITLVVSQVIAGVILWKLMLHMITSEKFWRKYLDMINNVFVNINSMEYEENKEED